MDCWTDISPKQPEQGVAALDIRIEERELGPLDLVLLQSRGLCGHRKQPQRQLTKLNRDRAHVHAVAGPLHDPADAFGDASLDFGEFASG